MPVMSVLDMHDELPFLRHTPAKPLCSSANGERKIIKNCTFVHRHSKDLLDCAEHHPHAASQLLDERRYSLTVCFPTPLFSYAIYICSCWGWWIWGCCAVSTGRANTPLSIAALRYTQFLSMICIISVTPTIYNFTLLPSSWLADS